MATKKITAIEMINMIKSANVDDFEIVYDRDKNFEFISYYDLYLEDIIEILKNIKKKHFDGIEKCNDNNYDVSYWYRFIISLSLSNPYGGYDYVEIFIRIGVSNGKYKLIVRSFHDDDLYKVRGIV